MNREAERQRELGKGLRVKRSESLRAGESIAHHTYRRCVVTVQLHGSSPRVVHCVALFLADGQPFPGDRPFTRDNSSQHEHLPSRTSFAEHDYSTVACLCREVISSELCNVCILQAKRTSQLQLTFAFLRFAPSLASLWPGTRVEQLAFEPGGPHTGQVLLPASLTHSCIASQ